MFKPVFRLSSESAQLRAVVYLLIAVGGLLFYIDDAASRFELLIFDAVGFFCSLLLVYKVGGFSLLKVFTGIFLLLLVPVWARNDFGDLFIYQTALAAAATLGVFLCSFDWVVQKTFLIVFLFVVAFFENVVCAYKNVVGQSLEQTQVLALLDTNLVEAFGYLKLHTVFSGFLLFFIVGSSGVLFFSRKVVQGNLSWKKALFYLVLSFGFLGLIFSTCTFRYTRLPLVALFNSSLNYKKGFKSTVLYRREHLLSIGAVKNADFVPALYVVVIGESACRDHLHLYGYVRDTTPLLEKRKSNLVVFRDAISSQTDTISSLRRALTLATVESGKEYVDDGFYSIIEILRSAGFKTYWLSNQAKWGFWGSTTTLIASGADETYFQNSSKNNDDQFMKEALHKVKEVSQVFATSSKSPYQTREDIAGLFDNFDENLLVKVKEVIQHERGPAVLFVHLMGSHWPYDERYPASFRYFEDENFFGPRINGSLVNAYDNSIRYTDFIVNQIIEELGRRDLVTSLIYFSDHGESVMLNRSHDPAEYTPGHVEVPFVLWYSDLYQKIYSPMVDVAHQHETSPFMLDSLSQVLMDWVHIQGPFYRPERSLLNAAFAPSPRMTVDGQKNYDAGKTNYCQEVKKATGFSMGPCSP